MSLKVFLSYSTDPSEQVIVWRLQTLASAHGIQMLVPSRGPQTLPTAKKLGLPSQDVRRAIDQSDYVLAIITARTSRDVEKELNYAAGKGKTIIPIVQQGVANGFLRHLQPVFVFSPGGTAGEVERQVVQYLRQQKAGQEAKELGWLVAIGLGMLLLSQSHE